MAETAQTVRRTDKASRPDITIACKVGLSWIDLRICEPKEVQQQTQTGSRTVIEHRPTGEFIRIRGTAYPRGEAPEEFPDRPRMIIGYALTTVKRDLWDKYTSQFQRGKEPEFLKSGMIFACESDDDIRAEAKERKDQMSGLEPIQKNKDGITDPRATKSMRGDVTNIQPDIARMTSRQPV